MKVETIDNIERVPLAIDYRRIYRGVAKISIGERTVGAPRIEFSLELSPFGQQEVSVSFLERADYPLVPAIRILKEHIKTLDGNGQLP
jgi:hypothetical protein